MDVDGTIPGMESVESSRERRLRAKQEPESRRESSQIISPAVILAKASIQSIESSPKANHNEVVIPAKAGIQ